MTTNSKTIQKILSDAILLAKKYRSLTGKPLGITGEVAEFSASVLLKNLKLTGARTPGYDGIWTRRGKKKRVQIKGRSFPKDSKKAQRVGIIKLEKPWHSVLLVILDEDFRTQAIYEAERAAIKKAIEKPGSKARERGALTVNFFKRKGICVWPLKGKNAQILQ